MSATLLVDTHIAIWLDAADERLRPATRDLIDQCWLGGGSILLSAVTAWEIALLADRGRLHLDVPAGQWVQRFLDRPGVAAAPLTLSAAARSYALQNLEHRDPADRLLIATAIELACPLVTYDAPIVRYAKMRGQRHGFSVAS